MSSTVCNQKRNRTQIKLDHGTKLPLNLILIHVEQIRHISNGFFLLIFFQNKVLIINLFSNLNWTFIYFKKKNWFASMIIAYR